MWPWACTVSFTRWSFETLMVSVFHPVTGGDAYLSDVYDFNYNHSTTPYLLWECVWLVSLQTIIIVGLCPPSQNMKLIDFDSDHIRKFDVNELLEEEGNTNQYENQGTRVKPLKGNMISLADQHSKTKKQISSKRRGRLSREKARGSKQAAADNETSDVESVRSNASTNTSTMSAQPHGNSVAIRDCADRFSVIALKASQQVRVTFQRLKYELHTQTNPNNANVYRRSSFEFSANSQQSMQHTQDYVFQNISGNIEPGNTLCILDGQSCLFADSTHNNYTNTQSYGAGSTLLQILAGRAPNAGKVTGTIRVNGGKLKRGMSYINAAYVYAGDVCLSPITVREFVQYAAMLRRTDQKTCPMITTWCQACGKRLYKNICKRAYKAVCACVRRGDGNLLEEEDADDYRSLDAFDLIGMTGDVKERVEEVIKLMGLEDVADTVLANTHPHTHKHMDYSSSSTHAQYCNITPAQLRCLSIGVELVNRPGLIFLEDPVRGLDWCDADVVATAIQCLAQGGRSVVATLQTPSYRVHQTFSDTILIGSGLMLYCGATSRAQQYFENIGELVVVGYCCMCMVVMIGAQLVGYNLLWSFSRNITCASLCAVIISWGDLS
jgi:hypothetical protein